MTDKTKVTLIQSKDGVVRTARIGDTELEVASAGPTLNNGEVVVVMTIRNVDVVGEMAADAAPAGA